MKKLSHSKYRNTGIIFETLVHQVTSDLLSENGKESSSVASNIIDRYFKKGSVLDEENKLYQMLIGTTMSAKRAQALIEHVIDKRGDLDNSKLESLKYDLIGDIKEQYDLKEFFKTRIKNYRTFASIYKLFEVYANDDVNVKYDKSDINECYQTVKKHVISGQKNQSIIQSLKKENKEMKTRAEEIMIKRFDEKYGGSLNENQTDLIKEYVSSGTRPNQFRWFVTQECERLQEKLNEALKRDITDKVISIKLQEATHLLDEMKHKKMISEKQAARLMMYYELEERIDNGLY